MSWLPLTNSLGFVRERMGADTVNVLPHSHYQTKDGRWIAIACSNDNMFARLARAMGQPALAAADRYGPKQARPGRPGRSQRARQRMGGIAPVRRGPRSLSG